MSTPFFDPDDPRLTAYALGEATTEERQIVERILAASPEARAAVEQTRALARLLEEDYLRENVAYQEAHAQPVIPANVTPFPGARRGRWRPAVLLAWKVAAAFVALGSLVWFSIRRTPPAPVASVQPAAPAPVARPEPSAKNDSLLAAVPNPEAWDQATRLDAEPSAPLALAQAPPAAVAPMPSALKATPMPTVSSEAPEDAGKLLAAAPNPEARGGASQLDATQSAPGADRAAQAPAAAEAPLLAAARPAPPPAAPKAGPVPSANNRLTALVVRLRQPDGSFFGGILLSADGWILVTPRPSVSDKSPRITAVLSDGREFAVASNGTGPSSNLLRINTQTLPAVQLAADAPGDGSTLMIAHVDERTGAVTITRARAKHIGSQTYLDGPTGGGDFVFNDAGQLLATEQAPAAAKFPARAQAAARRQLSTLPLVRPFTAEERAALAHPSR